MSVEAKGCERQTNARLLSVQIPGVPDSVRRVLLDLRDRLEAAGFGTEATGALEIALAEVLNNVCEHAYADQSGGCIELRVWRDAEGIAAEVVDDGCAMREGRLPEVRAATPATFTDLPEGGYGWRLVREVADNLSYARVSGRNRLTLHVPLEPPRS